jgi:hypothetical protein
MVIVRMGTDLDPPDEDAVLNTFLRRLGQAVSPLAETSQSEGAAPPSTPGE